MAVASGPACEAVFWRGVLKKSALRGPEFFFALRATISVSAKCYPLSKLDS